MRVFEFYTANTLEMIIEANVMNVKDEYQGTSIHNFLNNYVDSFRTKEAKQMWLKKLAKLFINDNRYLNVVRDLPADAPEWAQKAAATGDLFYFQPTPELKDHMDHLSHYVAGLEADMTGNNPDAKAYANREFQGFMKAENLETLVKKSNEYFKRGSKKAGRDIEGMTKLMDVDGGFSWWKLDTQAAYAREGKALQNCIGSHWTKAKTDQGGYSIVVMKNHNMESVVAARISNKSNALDEMKGKNNKPPIPKYMPGVQALMNKFKLDANRGALYDIKRAGYYYQDQKLYTKAQAARDLVQANPITKISNRLTMNEITSSNQELLKDLYGTNYSQYRNYSPEEIGKVYDVRTKDNIPLLSAVVVQGELTHLQRYIQPTINQGAMHEAAEQSMKDTTARQFLSALMRMGLVKTVTPKLQREIFWNDKMAYNAEKGDFEETKADEDVTVDKKQHRWQAYTGSSVRDLANSLRREHVYTSDQEKDKKERAFLDSVNRIYVTTAAKATGEQGRETDKILALAVNPKGETAPYIIRGADVHRGKTLYDRDNNLDEKTLNSIIGLANAKDFSIPRTLLIRHGIGKTKDGHYSREVLSVKPESMAGDIPAKKWDFTKIPIEDRLAAVVRAITEDIRSNKDHWNPGKTDEFGIMKALREFTTGSTWGDWEEADFYWGDKDTKKWLSDHFAGKIPDGLISVDIGYGHDKKHAINMLTHGNKIIQIDDDSKNNNWQKWDDFETITEQLNKFAKANHLTFDPQSTNKSKEFNVDKQGQIRPEAALKKEQIERLRSQGRYGKEGVDELPFANGAKLKRMDPEQQGKWLRLGIEKKTAGEAWYLEMPDGSTPAAFFVSKGKVTQMYHTASRTETEAQTQRLGARSKVGVTLPTERGPRRAELPYIKAAAEKFGWQMGPQMQFSARNRLTSVLQDYDARGTRNRYSIKPTTERPLVNLGLLNAERRGRHMVTMSVSHKGKQVLRHIAAGTPVDLTDLVTGQPVSPDFNLPEKPAQTTRRAAGPRAPRQATEGGGTKSQRALTRYNEMTAENGRAPSRSEFMQVLMDDPFNMSSAGAQTYYYNVKKKAQQANEGVRAGRPLGLSDLFDAYLRSK